MDEHFEFRGGPGRGPARLEDRWEISELLKAYAFHFDRNEPDAVAALFSADAVIDYGPEVEPIRGRDTIAGRIGMGLSEIFEATSHHISNISVEFESETLARAVAYVHAWHRYRDGSPDGYLWGQYHTRLARAADGWRIVGLVLQAAGTADFHRATMHPIERASGS